MRPFWGYLKGQVKAQIDLDWMPVETAGPLELILTAELEHETIDWLEVRAGASNESIERKQGGLVVTMNEWEGLIMLKEGIEPGGFSTDKRATLEEAISVLKEVCRDEFALEI